MVSHTTGSVLSGSNNRPVVDWPRDTTTTIVTNVNLLHFYMKLSHYSFWPSFIFFAGARREHNNVSSLLQTNKHSQNWGQWVTVVDFLMAFLTPPNLGRYLCCGEDTCEAMSCNGLYSLHLFTEGFVSQIPFKISIFYEDQCHCVRNK